MAIRFRFHPNQCFPRKLVQETVFRQLLKKDLFLLCKHTSEVLWIWRTWRFLEVSGVFELLSEVSFALCASSLCRSHLALQSSMDEHSSLVPCFKLSILLHLFILRNRDYHHWNISLIRMSTNWCSKWVSFSQLYRLGRLQPPPSTASIVWHQGTIVDIVQLANISCRITWSSEHRLLRFFWKCFSL